MKKTQKIPLKTATLSDWMIPRLKKGQKSIFQKKIIDFSILQKFQKIDFLFFQKSLKMNFKKSILKNRFFHFSKNRFFNFLRFSKNRFLACCGPHILT